ncbi:MAG: HK97 gp10 family phage protein [Romboutsia timonensis]
MANRSVGTLKFKVNIKGIEEYKKNVENAIPKFRNFEYKFLNTLANMVIEKAMPNTPVDTGRLRRSYKVTKVQNLGSVIQITVYNDARSNGADESYASYVELGHFTRNRITWVEGHYMLTIATDQVKAEMSRVWRKLFNEWVKESGL